jgi:hypothetical protein
VMLMRHARRFLRSSNKHASFLAVRFPLETFRRID